MKFNIFVVVILAVVGFVIGAYIAYTGYTRENAMHDTVEVVPIAEDTAAKENVVEVDSDAQIVPVSDTLDSAEMSEEEESATPMVAQYSFEDVAQHASEASCWTVVNQLVYDVTSFIRKHPGGAKNILKICGKDGTSLFEGQHGGDMKPEQMLASFKIGELIAVQ
jgi:cytochrome b involved in lipid metabolism